VPNQFAAQPGFWSERNYKIIIKEALNV